MIKDYESTINGTQDRIALIARFSIGFFQAVSFLFLSIGIKSIRKHIIANGMQNKVNYSMIWIHSALFLTYLLVGTLFYGFLLYYYRVPAGSTEKE